MQAGDFTVTLVECRRRNALLRQPVCNSGTCKSGCFIAGAFYANAAANPTNACQTCQASFAATSWTTSANGASCGSGQVCSGGTCQSGCWIDGALVGSGTTNTANVCQICKPTASASAWSNNTDGTPCGTGKVCGTGTCQIGCYLGGTVYAAGSLNPANSCQSCAPSTSTTSWYQVPSDCTTIAAHDQFTCATVGGIAKCWGRNGYGLRGGSVSGLLGIGQSYDQTPQSAVPLGVSGLVSGVWAISTGSTSDHSCAVVSGGVVCWGANATGALGNGATADANAPVQVAGLTSGVQGVATGASHSCAIVSGQVYCWGDNGLGQLGQPPAASPGEPDPCVHVLGRKYSGDRGWGQSFLCSEWRLGFLLGIDAFGQLGNNSTTDSYVPVQPAGLGSNVQAVAAGGDFTCALANGSLACWGHNNYGQLGDGTIDGSIEPGFRGRPVRRCTGCCGRHITRVHRGQRRCVVLGWNGDGQLGDATITDRCRPLPCRGLLAACRRLRRARPTRVRSPALARSAGGSTAAENSATTRRPTARSQWRCRVHRRDFYPCQAAQRGTAMRHICTSRPSLFSTYAEATCRRTS